MDRGAWQDIVHGVAMSQTWLSDQHFHILKDIINHGIFYPWLLDVSLK